MRLSGFKLMTLIAIGFGLGACGGSGDYSDLQGFMDDVDSRPKASIDPLPTFARVEPFAYKASGLRSPFEPPVVVKPGPGGLSGPKVEPNPLRVKEYLEQFSIASLAMVGTLAQGEAMYALIQDGDGGVHRVQMGDYMGTDHGKIQSIDETEIELVEIVPDGAGSWVERIRTVSLGGGDRG